MRNAIWLFCICLSASASDAVLKRANTLYLHTEYNASLQVLARDPAPDAATFSLSGKNYFMLEDYKKAVEHFEKAVALQPQSSDYMLWLGRSYGRRAETSNWFSAGSQASKARQCFEKAVALDEHNDEALNDLFDYYLNAPGFLGGGIDKAEAIARRTEKLRPAEGHFDWAQIAEKRKQLSVAEQHYRSALALAPEDPGRIIDLARFLAKHGRIEESDALFAHAQKVAPDKPRVLFATAKAYIDTQRKPVEAQQLLRRYLASDLTPDDPPKRVAEKLLKQESRVPNGG
jgi:tetratricopeptide (TPR) repeat protein